MIKDLKQIIDKEELLANLQDLAVEERREYFNSLSDEELINLFIKLDRDAYLYITEVKESLHSVIISKMQFSSAVGLINELDDEQRDSYLYNSAFKEKLDALRSDFLNLHPKDVANKLEEMSRKEREEFYKLFNAEELSEFFAHLDEEDAANFITELSDNKASDILEEMDVDDAVDVINELDEEDADNYLNLMDSFTKTELDALSKYDEDEAASLMDTNFIEIDDEMDVKDAMKILVEKAPDVSLVTTLFVSSNSKFIGTVDFRKLIVTKSPCKIKDITDTVYKSVNVDASIDEVLNIVDNYDIYALPVLLDGKIEGIITIDDALRKLSGERKEDYNQLAGISGDHEDDEKISSSLKKRLPWLLILCFLDIIVCLVISLFEGIIEKMVILVIFEPIVLGLAGNVGTQSLAVCVRSIAQNNLNTKKKKFIHVLKELRNGLVNGVVVGIILFIITSLYMLTTKSADYSIFKMSVIISFSIMIAISFSGMFGCLIPIVFNSLNIDPAAASGPFITTLNDIISIVIYFGLATLFFIL